MTFAQLLKTEMRIRRLNQAKAARRTGMKKAMMSYLVNEQRKPSLKTALKVMRGLGIPMRKLEEVEI